MPANFWPDTMRNEPQKERRDDQRDDRCSDGYKFLSKSAWLMEATRTGVGFRERFERREVSLRVYRVRIFVALSLIYSMFE